MPRSILLADDSVTIQTAAKMAFAMEDVTLTTVGDGESALTTAQRTRPDLILADVSMPGLSGFELCQRIRGDGNIAHIPVLLLGGGTPVDPTKAFAVGANGQMSKPFDSTKLIDSVKTLLANPQAQVLPPVGKGAPVAAKPAPSAAPPAAAAPAPRPAVTAPPPAAKPAPSTQPMAKPPPLTAPPAARPAAPAPMAGKPAPIPGKPAPTAPP
ncbi:MAG: response regulator, partial [Deltaproteobacteria bacterium]|nr:response regulator [Deltaproteobacteria bacterium]